MKNKNKLVGSITLVLAALIFLLYMVPVFAQVTVVAGSTMATTSTSTIANIIATSTKITHQQEVWLHALEWCESHGNPKAINKVDRDGTPSYGAWQFKPQTFATLSKKYGVVGDIMDEEAQRQVVIGMLLDKSISNDELRYHQFPDCIQRKVGLPQR